MKHVSPEALARLAARQRQKASTTTVSGRTYDAREMLNANDADLSALGISTGKHKPNSGGGQVWELSGCPYSNDHTDAAFRIQYPDGGIHIGCHHDRCQGKTIKSAPDLFPQTLTVNRTPPLASGGVTFGGKPLDRVMDSTLADRPNGPVDSPLRLLTRRASAIDPKPVDWLWTRWLPAGMLTLLAGYGGSGKSTIALSIATAGSVGGTLPDGQQAPVLNTLIFAAEDSPEHTIIPRAMAMGADLDRIHIVSGVARDNGEPGWVQLRNHAAAIEHAVVAHDIGLVVIDPVSSFIGDANSDRESDVRSGILPLVAMAERTGAAVLMIRHLSKAGDGHRAASRILGSTAWHDVPRAIWMLGDAPDDHQPEPGPDGLRDTRRVLGVVKSNLAAKPVARWCVQPVDGSLYWLPDPSPVTIDECFIPPSTSGGKARDAEAWLAEHLAGGSQPTSRVEAAAKDAGISERTLKRARSALNVRARKEPSGMWVIGLPPRLEQPENEGGQPEPRTDHLAALHNKHDNMKLKDATLASLAPFPEPRGNRANGQADDSEPGDSQGGQVGQGGQGGQGSTYGKLAPFDSMDTY